MSRLQIKNTLASQLRVGINVFREVSVPDPGRVENWIKRELLALQSRHLQELPPGFQWSRKLYHAFAMDPTRYRPASEALWRRVKKELDFPRVNPLVDLTNLLSVQYLVPYGLYDLEKITGDIAVTLGAPGETYQGIRKDMLNLEGKIVLKDNNGAFGNPSSDSLRTSTSIKTKQLLQVIYFHPQDPLAEDILFQSRATTLENFTSSEIDTFII